MCGKVAGREAWRYAERGAELHGQRRRLRQRRLRLTGLLRDAVPLAGGHAESYVAQYIEASIEALVRVALGEQTPHVFITLRAVFSSGKRPRIQASKAEEGVFTLGVSRISQPVYRTRRTFGGGLLMCARGKAWVSFTRERAMLVFTCATPGNVSSFFIINSEKAARSCTTMRST